MRSYRADGADSAVINRQTHWAGRGESHSLRSLTAKQEREAKRD